MSVVTRIREGLGNKLFTLVHCLIVGEQYNRKALIYFSKSTHERDTNYEIIKYFPSTKKLITEITKEQYENYERNNNYLMDEEICFAKINSNVIILKGFMMLKYYLLNNEWRKWILNILKPISLKDNKIKKTCIGIHIRVGDFLNYKEGNKVHPLYKPEYYIDIIKKYPKYSILFFTDTGQNFIMKHILPKINNEYEFIKGNALEDLINLSKCDILILSASTFSFWAGYLSSGVKYCPKYWLMTKIRLENSTIIDTDMYIMNDYRIYR